MSTSTPYAVVAGRTAGRNAHWTCTARVGSVIEIQVLNTPYAAGPELARAEAAMRHPDRLIVVPCTGDTYPS